ncbi:MAG: aminotransferase class I and II [Chloroflexi bacterium]|nr:aminotransferase class I and II [Chloroflexota bacterium]
MERLLGTRYVVPLREGGSLPAVVETVQADGLRPGGPFVVKFRGAGQGAKALVAEVLVAGLAEVLGLPVPRPAIIELSDGFGNAEPDPEIQDILKGSVGENFGLAFLSGALPFDPSVDRDISPQLAADIVWLDALVTNVDRSARNTNLLLWHGRLWLIDHGASLYVHHRWEGWESRVQSAFPQIKDHVLLPLAGDLAAADARLRPTLTEPVLREIVERVPESWLGDEDLFPTLEAQRAAYVTYLSERLNGPRAWLAEAISARARGPERLAVRQTHRLDADR